MRAATGTVRSESCTTRAPRDEPDPVVETVRSLLAHLGVPAREIQTVDVRTAAETFRRLTAGYGTDPRDVVGDALFDEAGGEAVVVRDIPFTSLCRHGLVPFGGRAHVAYLPGTAVVGLSKLARLVDLFAHRLQTPDRLAADVANAVQTSLGAEGVGVRIEAGPCGVDRGETVVTQAFLGAFRLPLWRTRLVGLL